MPVPGAPTEGTAYEGGEFHMKLTLSSEFPRVPPKGQFITKIFHPNVAESGDICVNTLKRDWDPNNTLAHVLQVIRCLLIVPFPESSLNETAGKLFMEDYDEFLARAKLMTDIHAKPAHGMDAAAAAAGVGEELGTAAAATTTTPSAQPATTSAASGKTTGPARTAAIPLREAVASNAALARGPGKSGDSGASSDKLKKKKSSSSSHKKKAMLRL